ncbi:glycosyltransferase WbsX family protein [Taibaiella soli]|uniref:Glycosyl hydrolase n=1 Tax=Taibaiella soli TaxID=1649169 RepID=A0A2W2AWG6_9BACT|nr:glycoside hydrolase family 99-like domain-containing protein [Taibaiella soli]PZF72038.1 glycosyl hydrolase [Taibaiella soli]
MRKKLRPIAIYLPQFHPVAENDEWWGKGFTEWRNVTKATPLYRGHYQPHLPADLGFYDLRLPETREAQARLAQEYGIYGFCYYHYWFNGRRILERPFQEVFESGKPDFPFMLCWANENWTRVWDGGEKNVLLEQKYNSEDDANHIKSLLAYFKDPRYIRIDSKPVFAVYKASLLPDIRKTVEVWREVAREAGVELYLCNFESLGEPKTDPKILGLDATIQFPPFGILNINNQNNQGITASRIKNAIWSRVSNRYKKLFHKANFLSYDEMMTTDLASFPPAYKQFPCVTPMWDNTSRRKKPTILKKSTPEKFEQWVRQKVARFKPFSDDENLFFINAWNEWAEGNHLEPCQRWGKQYLEALKKGIGSDE